MTMLFGSSFSIYFRNVALERNGGTGSNFVFLQCNFLSLLMVLLEASFTVLVG